MFKLVVLSALLAVACAKPSGVAHLAYTAPAVVAAPSAVSHTYRSDVISEPVVAAYTAPVVAHRAHYAAPVVTAHAAPIVAAHAAPYAAHVVDAHHVAAPYAAHVVDAHHVAAPWGYAAAAPISLYTQRRPISTKKMFKLVVFFALVAAAVAKPSGIVYSAHPVSSAVSHTYRKDIISEPVVVAPVHAVHAYHHAPVVAVAAPAVSHSYRKDVIHSSPVVSVHAVPVVVAAHGYHGHHGW
nr:unnamed protein product [Callosobruchus chinensis]